MKVMTSFVVYDKSDSEKRSALLEFVKRNFDCKLIDMDDRELVSVVGQELRLLNEIYSATRTWSVDYRTPYSDCRRLVVEVKRSGKVIFHAVFVGMDMEADLVTPVFVKYTSRTNEQEQMPALDLGQEDEY